MIWTRLYNVVGKDDLEGITFARCTTYEKAQKAKEILETEGFEGSLDIFQDKIPVDVIEVDSQLLELQPQNQEFIYKKQQGRQQKLAFFLLQNTRNSITI